MGNDEKILQALSQMQGDINEIKNGMSEIKDDTVNMKSNMATIKERLDNLGNTVDNLKESHEDLKNVVMRMENEQGKQLGVLFDGYSNLYDVLKGIRVDIGLLRTDSEKHDLYLKWFSPDKKIAN